MVFLSSQEPYATQIIRPKMMRDLIKFGLCIQRNFVIFKMRNFV